MIGQEFKVYFLHFKAKPVTMSEIPETKENAQKEAVAESLADAETINKLSEGLLGLYQPELKKVKQQLDELTKKQTELISQLQTENQRFTDPQISDELQEMFSAVKHYQTKLVSIKKEMAQLHERTSKVKKRALKLQQNKQKEALQREHQRELQLQREQELIAKPSSSNKKS